VESVIWLAAAWLASCWRPNDPVRAAAMLLACVGGTTLPDIDFTLWLAHRSALTHSVLPVALLACRRDGRAIAPGLAVGIGIHLAADCFPNAMRGYATVKLPLAGSIGSDASYLWLAVNAVAAMAIGVAWQPRPMAFGWRIAALAGCALIGAAYLFVTDGGWPALGIFGVAGWLAVRRRRAARTA
jgi:hypothetical protein